MDKHNFRIPLASEKEVISELIFVTMVKTTTLHLPSRKMINSFGNFKQKIDNEDSPTFETSNTNGNSLLAKYLS